MQLAELLAAFFPLAQTHDREITQLCLSSRDVKPGALFFAYPGETTDGRNYIEDAIHKGAVAIIKEVSEESFSLQEKSFNHDYPYAVEGTVVIISMPNVQDKIGPIAQIFYHHPSKNMQIIGVTGTNGKTSVAYILAQIFNCWQISAAIIGTLGIGKPGHLIANGVTTPDPIIIQNSLAELKRQGCKVVIMEVSSHALMQGRVQGLIFDAAIFTNLTQDHLDYHVTMEAYGWAKERFLVQHEVKNAIFNLDDLWCNNLYQKYHRKSIACFGYSMHTASKKLLATKSQLIGQFNVQNILAAATCLLSLGYKESEILSVLPEIKPVPGRLELLPGLNAPHCVIDYAHTPDALKKALLAVREFTTGKVYCVFGCGGNRDAGKRPLMAAVAEEYADVICLTDDNPRYEASQKILQDIATGFSSTANVVIIADRETAIRTTLLRAVEGDTVLIAGKGHEDYQIIQDQKIFFSDKLIANKVLNNLCQERTL